MKQTIKKDRERNIIKRELLDDNTLLEVELDNGQVIVTVRFVNSSLREIKEHTLLRMGEEEFKEHGVEVLQVSDAKDAIAIFKVAGEEYHLEQVYDIKEHEFGIPEFLDIIYQKKFPSHPLKNEYVKERKGKEG